jgi:hypothetical protein
MTDPSTPAPAVHADELTDEHPDEFFAECSDHVHETFNRWLAEKGQPAAVPLLVAYQRRGEETITVRCGTIDEAPSLEHACKGLTARVRTHQPAPGNWWCVVLTHRLWRLYETGPTFSPQDPTDPHAPALG